jgi:hypothetical protein
MPQHVCADNMSSTARAYYVCVCACVSVHVCVVFIGMSGGCGIRPPRLPPNQRERGHAGVFPAHAGRRFGGNRTRRDFGGMQRLLGRIGPISYSSRAFARGDTRRSPKLKLRCCSIAMAPTWTAYGHQLIDSLGLLPRSWDGRASGRLAMLTTSSQASRHCLFGVAGPGPGPGPDLLSLFSTVYMISILVD